MANTQGWNNSSISCLLLTEEEAEEADLTPIMTFPHCTVYVSITDCVAAACQSVSLSVCLSVCNAVC